MRLTSSNTRRRVTFRKLAVSSLLLGACTGESVETLGSRAAAEEVSPRVVPRVEHGGVDAETWAAFEAAKALEYGEVVGPKGPRAACGVVKVYYVLPSDAAQTDRQEVVAQMMAHNQGVWAGQGATYGTADLVTLVTPHDSAWWQTTHDGSQDDWEYLDNLEDYLAANTDYVPGDTNTRVVAFIELEGTSAAWGSSYGGVAAIPEWAISGGETQLQTDTSCNDHNDNCAYWASVGECDTNPDYMLTT